MSDNVAVVWNNAALEAVRRTRTGPPIAARALHVLHASMYRRLGGPRRPVPLRSGRPGQADGRARARPGRRRPRRVAQRRGRRGGQGGAGLGRARAGHAAHRGEEWRPYLATPPFPGYPSGHSTFSSAAAAVLARLTGSDRFGASVTIPAGSSRIEPGTTPAAGVTLSWPTFTDAAVQAGRSRRYGGIHFREGDLAGQQLGRAVGARVWAAAAALFTGRRAGGAAA